jgi:hypothetical protein
MLKIQDVIRVLSEQKLPPATLIAVENKLEEIEADKKADKEGPVGPKSKNQFVFLASDPNNTLKGVELTGWVIQLEESADPANIQDRIKGAAKAFNSSKKGRKHPVSSIGETIQLVPRKFWKTENPSEKTLVKTKEPVFVHLTDNTL